MTTDLEAFRDHARAMSTADHKPDCARSCDCGQAWCCSCWRHPVGKPWGWAYLWDRHNEACPGPEARCPGCVTDADRALWGRLADETDAHLARYAQEGLFA